MQPVVKKTGGPDLDGNVWYRVEVPAALAKSGFATLVNLGDRALNVRFPPNLGHSSHVVLKGLGAPAKGRIGSAHFVIGTTASPKNPASAASPNDPASAGGEISGVAFAIGAASVVISVATVIFSREIGGFLIILPLGILLAAVVQGAHSKKKQ